MFDVKELVGKPQRRQERAKLSHLDLSSSLNSKLDDSSTPLTPNVEYDLLPGIPTVRQKSTDEFNRIWIEPRGLTCDTITEAFRNAHDGEEVWLQGGEYEEDNAIFITQNNISFRCREAAKVIGRGHPQPVLICRGKGIQVCGITFSHCPKAKESQDPNVCYSALQIDQGSAVVERCDISSQVGVGIFAAGSAEIQLVDTMIKACHSSGVVVMGDSSRLDATRCEISNCAGFGLLGGGSSAGQIQESSIHTNGRCNIRLQDDTSIDVSKCAVFGSQQGGIWLGGRCICHILECSIYNNLKAGLQASDSTAPIVVANEVFEGHSEGIVLHHTAKGYYIRNRVRNNQGMGVWCAGSASVSLFHNTLANNRLGGVMTSDSAQLIFSNNTVSEHKAIGVGLKDESDVFMDDNQISSNYQGGLVLVGHAKACVNGGTIERNVKGGIVCSHASRLIMESVEVRSQQIGLVQWHDSQAFLSAITMRDHDTNILVQQNSKLHCHRLEASGAKIGLSLIENSVGEIECSEISGNTITNLAVANAAHIKAKHNNITDGLLAWPNPLYPLCFPAARSELVPTGGRGVVFLHRSRGLLVSNSIIGNKGCGIECWNEARPLIQSNILTNNKKGGVHLKDESLAKLDRNYIFANPRAQLKVEGKAAPDVIENLLFGNLLEGGKVEEALVIMGRCKGLYRRNRFIENKSQKRLNVWKRHGLVVDSNCMISEKDYEHTVHATLSSFWIKDQTQCCLLIKNPDGEMCIAQTESESNPLFHNVSFE